MPTPDHMIVASGAPRTVTSCAAQPCSGTWVQDEVFVDLATGKFFCKACGPRLRYHRKKALGRGETLPITFSEIDERLSQPSPKPSEATI